MSEAQRRSSDSVSDESTSSILHPPSVCPSTHPFTHSLCCCCSSAARLLLPAAVCLLVWLCAVRVRATLAVREWTAKPLRGFESYRDAALRPTATTQWQQQQEVNNTPAHLHTTHSATQQHNRVTRDRIHHQPTLSTVVPSLPPLRFSALFRNELSRVERVAQSHQAVEAAAASTAATSCRTRVCRGWRRRCLD